MKVHLMERVPGSKGALTVLEIEFTSKARSVRVTTSEGLEPLDLRGERTGGSYDAAPTLTRLHVPLRVTADGSRTATVSVSVTDAAGLVAAEAWEGTVRLESPRRKAPSAALLLGGFGAVALGIGAFVVLPLLQPPSVPSLVGKPQGEAERALRALGFAPVVEQVDSEGNDGRVIAQVPAADTQPPKNAPVLLRVGRRPASIEVPQLVGRMRAEAESALAGTGVQVAVSLEDAPETSDGRVLRQRPAAGNNVAPGATIELVVGRRPAAAQRDVPDVTGLAVADAVAALERAGLIAKVEPAIVDAGSPKVGKVVEQAPTGGARLAERGAVTVRVGEEAKPPAVAQIPYVVGEPRAAAERALTAAGFDVVVEEVEPTAGAAGTVTSQDPAAGAARVGTRVTLRVPRAAGLPVAVAPPAMTDAPPAMGDPVVVAPPAMTDAPPAMGDPVVVAPPAMTDAPPAMGDPVVVAPPAMTDAPPAMGDPVVVAPPAMTDAPPAMGDPVVVAPPAMTDAPPAMGDPVVVAPPAMTDAPPAMADAPVVEVPAGPTAPDLRRLTRAQAVLEARRAGIRVSVTEVDVTSDTPDGIVLRQFPAPGAELVDGGIALVVARAAPAAAPTVPPTQPPTQPPTRPPTVPAAAATMPDLVGLTRAAAEEMLRTARVRVRVTDEDTNGDTPEGLVLHQKPSAGEPVGAEGAEIVVARRAAPPAAVVVPDVVGRLADDAQRVIRDAGYVPRLMEEPTTPERAGLVLRQEPVSMRPAAAGSSVVLYVGTSSAASGPPPVVAPPVVAPPVVAPPPTVLPPPTPDVRPLPPPLPSPTPGSDLPPPRRLSRPGEAVPPPLPGPTTPPARTPAPVAPPTRTAPVPSPTPTDPRATPVVPGPTTGRAAGVLAPGAGGETVVVPDFVGRDAAEAVEVAMRAGVLPVLVGDRDARAAAGRVRMQSTGAGAAARTGTPVTIQVGAGASPSMVDVPSVAGSPIEAAVARLSSAGFATSIVRVAARPGVFAAGVVVAQTPVGRFSSDQARVVRLFTTDR